MAEFTPGPWILCDDGTIRAKAFGKSDQMADYQGCIVCDLKAGTGCESWPAIGRKHAQPEASSNANLISAAPDLLAACEAFIDWVDNADAPKPGSLKIPSDKARAAIAKALGQ